MNLAALPTDVRADLNLLWHDLLETRAARASCAEAICFCDAAAQLAISTYMTAGRKAVAVAVA